jgi:hypothetical protein
MAVWDRRAIDFVLEDEGTDGVVATLRVMTPAGDLLFMGVPEEVGKTITVRGVHVQGDGPGLGPAAVGTAHLIVIAQTLLERFGYHELVVFGASRTTGRRPGEAPRVLRFTRRPAPVSRG